MKILLLLACAALVWGQETFSGKAALDAAIERAIEEHLIPGAVLIVGHNGEIVYHKAYGWRALIPRKEAMSEDTIFDAASLTKVIATTPCIMKLFEQGKLQIGDPVTKYLPEFEGGHSAITIRNLMTHFSGLRPDLDILPPHAPLTARPLWTGYQTGIQRALREKPTAPPGARFAYSDINFILLGEIVHRLSGKPLNEYGKETIFEPLGMKHTRFLPPTEWYSKIAPTEVDEASGLPIRAVVHDPTARAMGGVAGHAGVFTTGEDLAIFAQMMLDGGVSHGIRIFKQTTIQRFTTPQSPPGQPVLRGLGWDIDSPYSGNRGDLFPIGSYGHTGYTGTSMWIDPVSKSYVILLTNSVHPHSGKSIVALRRQVATIAAASLGIQFEAGPLASENEAAMPLDLREKAIPPGQVLNGLDVLARQNFAPLAGKRSGLITNQTGLSRDGRRNVDLMRAAGIHVVALFSPEHGMSGTQDQPDIENSIDRATGIPVISLYNGVRRSIQPEMLTGIDTLVFDIQDVGARFYTYSCTLLSSMEEAARRGIPLYVLDRPNPITGTHVEGPVLEKDLESFVGCFEMPVRHGLTYGELASMVNGERNLYADLHVIAMQNWHRGDWFDSTGLTWINPSPNMRNLNAALLYPGIAILEASPNFSVGRGTDAPFEQVGADWIGGRELAAFLSVRSIPGVRVYAARFRPTASVFRGKEIEGVRFVITDRNSFDSIRLGLELGYALETLYPRKLDWEACRFLIGNRAVLNALRRAEDPETILPKLQIPIAQFLRRREKYLLYP